MKRGDHLTLGDLIFKYRTENDISQREFASRCGVSNAYISMLEKNQNTKTGKPMVPSVKQFMAISHAMRLSMNEVLEMVDDKTLDPLREDVERIKSVKVMPFADNSGFEQIQVDENVNYPASPKQYVPATSEARILAGAVDRMPEADRIKLVKMAELMFSQYAEFFEKGTDANDS